MTYTLTNHGTAQSFLAQTEPAFLQEEVAYGLIYGVAVRLRDQPDRFPAPPYLATVHTADGRLAAAAAMTPPRNLLVYALPGHDPTPAFQSIAADLASGEWLPPAVNGPVPLSRRFAEIWQAETGSSLRQVMAMRAFELRQVAPPARVPGAMRQTTAADLEQVIEFVQAFMAEALPQDPLPQREHVERLITDGSAYLWEDGEPVSLAAKGRRTPHGVSVGYVYTPPARRGRGYASALVAGLSQVILDEGYAFATLFTDLANPTSNHIYQAIGYRPVCDYEEYQFRI